MEIQPKKQDIVGNSVETTTKYVDSVPKVADKSTSVKKSKSASKKTKKQSQNGHNNAQATALANILQELVREASDPTTPPERLQELRRLYRPKMQQALAQNPNTPTDILQSLAEHYPADVVNNPVFDLLLMADPNFLGKFSISAIASMASVATSESLLCVWATHSDAFIRINVAKNQYTPAIILRTLSVDMDERVRNRAAKNPQLPKGWLKALQNMCGDPSLKTAKPPLDISSEKIVKFYHTYEKLSKCSFIDLVVAHCATTPTQILQEIYEKNDDTAGAIYGDIYASSYANTQIMTTHNALQSIREALATHPSTPIAILEKYVNRCLQSLQTQNFDISAALQVIKKLLLNPSLTDELQLVLLQNLQGSVYASYDAKEIVCLRKKLGTKTQKLLANDEEVSIRLLLSKNPDIADDVLLHLALDWCERVRQSAQPILRGRIERLLNDDKDNTKQIEQENQGNRERYYIQFWHKIEKITQNSPELETNWLETFIEDELQKYIRYHWVLQILLSRHELQERQIIKIFALYQSTYKEKEEAQNFSANTFADISADVGRAHENKMGIVPANLELDDRIQIDVAFALSLIAHPHTPTKILEKLMRIDSYYVQKALSSDARMSCEQKNIIKRALHNEKTQKNRYLQQIPNETENKLGMSHPNRNDDMDQTNTNACNKAQGKKLCGNQNKPVHTVLRKRT